MSSNSNRDALGGATFPSDEPPRQEGAGRGATFPSDEPPRQEGAGRRQMRNPRDWRELEKIVKKLEPLGMGLEKPLAGDWLAEHKELGQTFLQYIGSWPTTATVLRYKIYIALLGDFSPKQRKVIQRVSQFMEAFYGLPVVLQPTRSLDGVDPKFQRTREGGGTQILTGHLLDELKKSLPADAAAYICWTSSDLWPGKGWNFVFGQAHLKNRVGVWSLCRFGNDFRALLRRTLALAVHETGHMFGMMHCAAYLCGMCGSNSLGESDQHPIHFCPECTPKVAYATGVDLASRANKLHSLCKQWGIEEEATHYSRSAELLAPTQHTSFNAPKI